MTKCRSYNERFGKMAGDAPLKSCNKLATSCPADTSVIPATTLAATWKDAS